MTMKPITPDEALATVEHIPDTVIETFNETIRRNLDPNSRVATVYQKDIVDRLIAVGLDRAEVFAWGWLNVEGAFREAGWDVEYDKPGYNETYDAHWRFRAPK